MVTVKTLTEVFKGYCLLLMWLTLVWTLTAMGILPLVLSNFLTLFFVNVNRKVLQFIWWLVWRIKNNVWKNVCIPTPLVVAFNLVPSISISALEFRYCNSFRIDVKWRAPPRLQLTHFGGPARVFLHYKSQLFGRQTWLRRNYPREMVDMTVTKIEWML